MITNAILDAITPGAIAAGLRLLQGNHLAPTVEGHVSILLNVMPPGKGAVIGDMGCGFGEVSRLIQQERPDLRLILLNMNLMQMREAPHQFPRVVGDMHAIPLRDGAVDVAMFCYSFCHSSPMIALREAHRITRPGGMLFIYDYTRMCGNNALMEARLCARAWGYNAMVEMARASGWISHQCTLTGGDDTPFRSLYANDEEYDLIFNDIAPSIWRMWRA